MAHLVSSRPARVRNGSFCPRGTRLEANSLLRLRNVCLRGARRTGGRIAGGTQSHAQKEPSSTNDKGDQNSAPIDVVEATELALQVLNGDEDAKARLDEAARVMQDAGMNVDTSLIAAAVGSRKILQEASTGESAVTDLPPEARARILAELKGELKEELRAEVKAELRAQLEARPMADLMEDLQASLKAWLDRLVRALAAGAVVGTVAFSMCQLSLLPSVEVVPLTVFTSLMTCTTVLAMMLL